MATNTLTKYKLGNHNNNNKKPSKKLVAQNQKWDFMMI